ncbi:MAG TPA: hypothetical protein GX708_05645 [Gallicola sp.]|nr:hypothetical protein [Gallicola sp.]
MKKIQIAATGYFLVYLFTFVLDSIALLNLNENLTSILSFISILVKFPKDILDIFLTYTGIGTIVLVICGVFFVKSVHDLFC